MLQRLNADLVEALLVVAAVAAVTEVSIVNIVPPMTVDTAPAGFVQFFQRLVVAAMAMKLGMDLAKLEISFVVVERPYQPVIGVMAGRAILPKPLFVHIVSAVAVSRQIRPISVSS